MAIRSVELSAKISNSKRQKLYEALKQQSYFSSGEIGDNALLLRNGDTLERIGKEMRALGWRSLDKASQGHSLKMTKPDGTWPITIFVVVPGTYSIKFGLFDHIRDKLQASSKEEASTKLDRWYDRDGKNWIVTLKDENGDQIGDAVVVGTHLDAMNVKKDHPSFKSQADKDRENEERYSKNWKKQHETPNRRRTA